MAFLYDNVPYPSSWAELVKDATLLKLFTHYAKKEALILENVLFLQTKRIPNRDYFEFIEPGSRSEINISGSLRQDMVALATLADANKWRHADWNTQLRASRNLATRVIC